MSQELAYFVGKTFLHLNKSQVSSPEWRPKLKSLLRRRQESESEDEKQHDAVEAESLRSKLHATVEEEIALQHPIVSLSRNICSLAREKKLSTLPVKMLREICENLGLNVDGITQRRKKPFIDLLTQLVGECSCGRK